MPVLPSEICQIRSFAFLYRAEEHSRERCQSMENLLFLLIKWNKGGRVDSVKAPSKHTLLVPGVQIRLDPVFSDRIEWSPVTGNGFLR